MKLVSRRLMVFVMIYLKWVLFKYYFVVLESLPSWNICIVEESVDGMFYQICGSNDINLSCRILVGLNTVKSL